MAIWSQMLTFNTSVTKFYRTIQKFYLHGKAIFGQCSEYPARRGQGRSVFKILVEDLGVDGRRISEWILKKQVRI